MRGEGFADMNYYFVGLTIAFVFLAAKDLRKHGWKRMERPPLLSAGSPMNWMIDRTYLLYMALAVIAAPAALIIRP
jgi:hypothetical protein